jgi:hypothetical protein
VAGVAIDGAGNAYICGAADVPATPGAFKEVNQNNAFVAKLNPAGSAFVYATFLGGSGGGDGASAILIDAAGNAWVTGTTGSADFPVTADAADSSFNGTSDVFLAKLNATGSALLYGSFWGGLNSDVAADLAIDGGGNVLVAGHTSSIDFPTTAGAFQTAFRGGDGFVVKFPTGDGTPAPPAPPPTPVAPTLAFPTAGDTVAQPVSFSWNVATGAFTYEIQIDDASTFTAPLERDVAGLTTIGYATTDLAAGTHFWRVRGINTAGTPGPFSATRSVVLQAPPPPPGLSTFSTNPSTVVGGDLSSGTVVLSTPAPSVGAVITLTSSNPAVASVPATTTVPPIGLTATFTITTAPVAANTTITITADYNGTTRTASLLVVPVPPPASLVSILVSPATVQGGNTTFGIVTLAAPAPPAGATVLLASSNPTLASPGPAVTVFPNQTTATFTVTTTSPSVDTALTISGTLNGVTRTTPLTVTTLNQSPPPPAGTATLTVSATGRSGERVSSSPSGISVAVGSTGSATFNTGTSITLSVSNGRDAIWAGACSSGGNKAKTCTFTLNGNASVSASVQ